MEQSMVHQDERKDEDLEEQPEQLKFCEGCGELEDDCVCDQLDDFN